MKKFLLIILSTVYYLLSTMSSYALSPTPSPVSQSPTPTISESNKSDAINQQINDLKNRIASRVAQLKLVEKRGIIGRVTDVSDTQITISDLKSNIRYIDVDELTRFYSLDVQGAFGISDLTKGTNIGVIGLYNKESRRLLARFVNVINLPKIIHGIVVNVNSESYTIKVLTEEDKEITFDVETTTKTLSFAKDAGLTKSGFSKIKENQRVIIVSKTDSKSEDKASSLRIILLPDIPKNPTAP